MSENLVEKKYAVPLKVGSSEPTFTIKDNKMVLSSGEIIEKQYIEKFMAGIDYLLNVKKPLELNKWESGLMHLMGVFWGIFLVSTFVKIVEGVTLIPYLTGLPGMAFVTLCCAAWIFYFMDEKVLIRKRRQYLQKTLPDNIDVDTLVAALYNRWSVNKTISKEKEMLRKAMIVMNKIYLTPGLKVLNEDLNNWYKNVKLK